jgi:cytochrome c peroxidase
VLAKHKRRWVGLLVAISLAAASFGLREAGFSARSQTPTAQDQGERSPTPKSPPTPEAGPLAQPKSLDQAGLPAELVRRAVPPDNPQTPKKIALGERLFFDGCLSADGTVACSTYHGPA